jgi:dihydrofolate reductase
MEKIIIVAYDEERAIGKDGDIPWHYSEDMKRFKEKTTGHSVIMGRKTYFSLPEDFRPLPDRKNIVLSRSYPDLPESVEKANSLDQAYKIAEENGDKAFIAGGESVYRQALNNANKMVITKVPETHDGDTFFPEWNKSDWEKTLEEETDEGLAFLEWRRKK